MATYRVKVNQLLNDIAIEHYGDHDRGMVALLQMNPRLNGPTDNVFEGDMLEVGPPFNSQVASQARIVGVATRTSDNIYRGIGYDLILSLIHI